MAESQRRGPLAMAEDEDESDSTSVPLVTAHSTSPERLVFTEEGNCDGWIATDLAVENWR